LSDKIVAELMQKCVCKEETCDPVCDKSKGCGGESCIGPCKNGSCKPIANIECCPANSGIFDPNTKKELTVRQVIEHGILTMKLSNGLDKDYTGLDEFRSKFSQSYADIKKVVEVQPAQKLNEKEITIINMGTCTACNYICKECNPNDKNYSKCLKDQQKCLTDKEKCEKDLQSCLKKSSPWHNLVLIDQLIYLQGKIEEMKKLVKDDSDVLKNAESSLGQCYIADTYVDFIKTYEQTNKKEKVIMVDKPFSDPKTQEKINPAKYCKGFEYNNSSCYSQCKDICPGTTEDDISCYGKCPDCTANMKPQEKERCLAAQAVCEKNCFSFRKCIYSDGSFSTFDGCMAGCKEQCVFSCNKYSGGEKDRCIQNCNNDSKCLLENQDKCLVNFNQLRNCSNSSACESQCNNDQDCITACKQQYANLNFKINCIENSAYKCTYCSDQYAGYPECLTYPYSLQNKYSSSFIYQHPEYQACSSVYEPLLITNPDGTKSVTTCLNLYPETAKCPASSKCPECPCDSINETVPYPYEPPLSCDQESNDSVTEKPVSEYKICSGNCDEYSYNDEPLTFYCQNSWWNKAETKNIIPIGHERICPKEKEIPVGKTIDDAEKWADDLIQNIDKITRRIKNMIQYMQRIGQEKDYCNCDSKCVDGKKICHTDCSKSTSTITNADGTTTTESTCSFVPCSGNPCQKMIELLLGTKCEPESCGNGLGIERYRYNIDAALTDFIIFTIQQNRSDVVKELEYSRQQTNNCSTVQNNYGEETRILSCTRVQDEIISPTVDKYSKTIIKDKSFTSYCYGKSLGEILKTQDPLADNWFCCEDRKKDK